MANISTLAAKLSLNSKEFESGLSKASEAGKKFKKETEGGQSLFSGISTGAIAATAAVAALAFAGKVIAENFGEAYNRINELSVKAQGLGINPESFQELSYLSKMTGAEFEEVNKGVGKMAKLLSDPAMTGTFSQLGLDAKQLQAMKPDKAFLSVIDALGKVENGSERMLLAQKLFGDEARKILPLVGRDMKGITDEAESLGLVLSGQSVAKIDLLKERFTKLQETGTALWNKLLVAAEPVISWIVDGALGLIKNMGGVDNIVNNIIWTIGALGDVGSDVFNSLKVIGGAWVLSQLKALQYLAKGIQEVGNAFGGEFTFAVKVEDFANNYAKDLGEAFDSIGKNKFSSWLSELTQKSDEAATVRAKEKEAINGTVGALQELTKEVEKQIKTYTGTATMEDIAKGKGENARLAKDYLKTKDEAQQAEADGNYKKAEALRNKAENIASRVNRRFVDPETGKEFTRQGRSVGDYGLIPGFNQRSGAGGGSRMQIKYADTNTDLLQQLVNGQDKMNRKLGVK